MVEQGFAMRDMKDTRFNLLTAWLNQVLGSAAYSIGPLANDASFRRHFRVRHQNQNWQEQNRIAIDAPPDRENSAAYVQVARFFAGQGIKVPAIFHADLAQGFLLVEDFGDNVYLQKLENNN